MGILPMPSAVRTWNFRRDADYSPGRWLDWKSD